MQKGKAFVPKSNQTQGSITSSLLNLQNDCARLLDNLKQVANRSKDVDGIGQSVSQNESQGALSTDEILHLKNENENLKEQLKFSNSGLISKTELESLLDENKGLKDKLKETQANFLMGGTSEEIQGYGPIGEFILPDFVISGADDSLHDLVGLLYGYYMEPEDHADQPEVGVLLGHLLVLKSSLGHPSLSKQVESSLFEIGKLIVNLCSGADPNEVQFALGSIAEHFNNTLSYHGYKLRVPRLGGMLDSSWMDYSPGSGRVSGINSWCVSDSKGTSIINAEIDN